MKIQIVILSVLVMALFSCSKYRLSDSDLKWQPYEVGDQLIFGSSRGEHDTIEIKSVEVHHNPDDPLSLIPNSLESLFVTSRFSGILTLKAAKEGSYVTLELRIGNNALKSPVTMLNLDENGIGQLEVTEFIGKNAYKIVAKQSASNLKDQPFDLRYIYWSNEYGYLGFEFKDGYTWKLKSFTRAGKNIL